MSAQTQPVFLLVGRGGKEHHIGPQGVGYLYAHVAQASESHDSHFLSLAHLPVPERRVRSDAGTQQRRHAGEVLFVWNVQDKVFIDHDAIGVAPVSHASQVLVFTVIGAGEADFAVLLQTLFTTLAGATGINHAADRGQVALLELFDLCAHVCNAPYNFMTRHTRINRVLPFVADGMQVRVTHATVENFKLYVARQGFAALKRKRRQRTLR